MVKAMKQGAEDFLSELVDEKELLDAVACALQRSEKNIAKRLADAAKPIAASLTDREHEVCQYVIGGILNKQIAR